MHPPPAEPSRDVLTQKREALLASLTKAQQLPDDYNFPDGRTKGDVLGAMRGVLQTLDQKLAPSEVKEKVMVGEADASTGIGKGGKVDNAEHYVTIGKTHIPICEPPKDRPKWKAAVSEMFVEGGKKWARVRFEKSAGGLSSRLKPGDEIPSGPHKGERLQVVDNILEGRTEVRAFNRIFEEAATLEAEYESLNPDVEGYDARAKQIAETLEKLRSGKASEVIDLAEFGIGDVKEYSGRVGEILSTQQFLQEVDSDSNEFIPTADPSYKLTPFFEGKLAWFAELINRQIGLGNNRFLEQMVAKNQLPEWQKLTAKGMTVVVGPRGVGKNKLAEHYCAVSERPLYRYACSPDKEERDLTYDVVLQDGDVVRIPSRVLTAVTTPNALLELDEVNLLRPSIAKFFNSLLDGDRAVFLNDQVIKAAPGVVFVGLMNPADYEGVENLPETIDDRSNVMSFGYPPLRETNPDTQQEQFTRDEALILKDHISPLASINDSKFTDLWNRVLNGASDTGSVDTNVVKMIKDLKAMITIADRTRTTVRAYKTRTGDTRMEREISLRGSIEAVRFYSEHHLWDADLARLPDYKSGWNAAQYAIAATYLPHTQTYKRGDGDRQALELILAEQIRSA